MAIFPESVTALTATLARLPGIGPRSAERLTLHLVQADRAFVRGLADAIIRARDQVTPCSVCGALTERQPCSICSDATRQSALLCVVERAVDIVSLEKSGAFKGRYHVLGGKLSPINGVGPEDLRIRQLEKRLDQEPAVELILALPSDVEGDATAFYLAKLMRSRGIRVSRLAHGLPVGGGLEFADELTLGRAIQGRQPIQD